MVEGFPTYSDGIKPGAVQGVLVRKEIIAAMGKKLRAEDDEKAEVDSICIEDSVAEDTFIQVVSNLDNAPNTVETSNYVCAFLVPKLELRVH